MHCMHGCGGCTALAPLVPFHACRCGYASCTAPARPLHCYGIACPLCFLVRMLLVTPLAGDLWSTAFPADSRPPRAGLAPCPH
jgi:hypothetical protein